MGEGYSAWGWCIGDVLVLGGEGVFEGWTHFRRNLCGSDVYPLLVLEFLLSLRDEILGGNVAKNAKR